MELIMPQLLAYAIQIGAFLALVTAWFILPVAMNRSLTANRDRRVGIALVALGVFLVAVWASAFLTGVQRGIPYVWIYCALTSFYGCMIVLFSVGHVPVFGRVHYGVVFSCAVATLVGVATLEQMGYVVLPGHASIDSIIRPASTTGSKQHYSLLLALLGLVLLQYHQRTKKRAYLLAATAAVLGSVASLTRAGPVLFAFAVFWALAISFRHVRARRHATAIVILIGVLGLVGAAANPTAILRVVSSIDPEAPGNPGRIEAWQTGIELWLAGPIVIGDHAGLVTQSAEKVAGEGASFHVESGVLQQLLNFGILGLVSFYSLFALCYLCIRSEHAWLRAAVVAGAFESLFYMSIEVFPFMLVIALLPVISHAIHMTYPPTTRGQ